MTSVESLPSYRDLPVKEGAPPGSSWGIWGDDDQLGTLNLLTEERTRRAAQEVRRGAVFPLNLPLEIPGVAWRRPPHHHLLHIGPEGPYEADGKTDGPAYRYRDDYVDGLWLQGGSQWDAFTHVRHQEFGNYNGIPDADVVSREALGVDKWAERAIVGRGVLLDLQRQLERTGRSYDPASAQQITVEDLQETIAAQDVVIETGDILVLHSGWSQRLLAADPEERTRILAWETVRAAGLEPSERMVEFLWNLHVAAIGSDTLGVEVMEMSPSFEFILHDHFLPLLGMPIGEAWMLDALARDCAEDGRYTFQFISVPLNLRGGVGSPPQAVAIK
jgi:kynurenine formamidase